VVTDAPQIQPLGRLELYMHLNLLSGMEPDTEDLMRERAEREFVDDEHDSPHSRPWFVSHHASQFPGDPLEACARKLVYRMMNIPSGEGAMAPWVTSTGAVGKAGELDIVDAWYKGGRMLGVPEDPTRPDVYQLGFVDRDHWLTGSTDLAILKRGWTRPHIVEIKGKADDVLVEMIDGRPMQRDGIVVNEPRQPDEAHARQLKATLGLAHEYDWGEVVVCRYSWRILWAELIARLDPSGGGLVLGTDYFNRCPEHGYDCQHAFRLEPPTTGEIYYWSRSWPRGNPRLGPRTKSFFYEYDPAYMEAGREILREARTHFEAGTIPPRHPSMQWSVGPCQNCESKIYCRMDEGLEPRKRKPTMTRRATLAESHGVEHALSVRPGYDLNVIRERVLSEWREET